MEQNMNLKIALGADPLGVELKDHIKAYLLEKGYSVEDFGGQKDHNIKYVEIADTVAKAVQSGKADRGIVFCGTGMGVSIVANKHKGVYCALVESVFAAGECREINDANMLAMGGRIVGAGMAECMVDAFLTTVQGQNGGEQRLHNLQAFTQSIRELEDEQFR